MAWGHSWKDRGVGIVLNIYEKYHNCKFTE